MSDPHDIGPNGAESGVINLDDIPDPIFWEVPIEKLPLWEGYEDIIEWVEDDEDWGGVM